MSSNGGEFQGIIDIIDVIVTFFLGVLALWGNFFRARFAGPQLSISLVSTDGEAVLSSDDRALRYYHVRVSNKRSWSPAHGVRVLIQQFCKFDENHQQVGGQLAYEPQIQWQFPRLGPIQRTIGATMNCDLGVVDESNSFEICTYVKPNNFDGRLVGPGELQITLVAVGDNARSKPLSITIVRSAEQTPSYRLKVG